MTSSSSAPKLPLWVFFATDVVLVAAAVIIELESAKPLSQTAILSIVGCIFVGILVLCVPLIAHYERQKNEMLDDRQRALEALARTITSSAEQISIATGGLNEIAELAQKNLRHAEQLPHKLQEKIAEFQAQLANANDAEKEELEKELEELRSSESDRLQTVSDKIAKAAAEFAKVEQATNQHLAAANDAVGKLAFTAAGAIGKAQAAAEQAFAQARQEASRSVGDAAGQAIKSIESAKTAAVSDLAREFDAHIDRLKQATQQLSGTIEQLAATATTKPAIAATPAPPAESTSQPAIAANPAAESIAAPPAAPSESPTPAAEPLTSPPKRPRKVRREEAAPAVEPPEISKPADIVAAAEIAATEASPEPAPAPPIADPAPQEPPPVAAETIAEVAPIAPETAEPFAPASPPIETPASTSETKAPRKRSPKQADDDQPALGLEIDEPKSESEENGENGGVGTVERVLTSDGATRLLVTAYIGIGNRLFIRGNGPGLSWEKGVPLQFVSIGKWRWETAEANGPIEVKLLKNDEHECAGLGTLTIEPGHQHEVTANFS